MTTPPRRRPLGSGGLSQLGPGKWKVTVPLGRDPVTGKYRQKSRTVHGDRKDAQLVLTDMLDRAAKGDTWDSASGTAKKFGPFLWHWLDHRRDSLAPMTVETYETWIRTRIEPALGHKPLVKLSPADLDEFYLLMRRRAGLAPPSVRKMHNIIHAALKQAVRWGYISANPADRVDAPTVPKKPVEPPSPADVRQLIDHLESRDPELATWLLMAAATGCRRSEVCAFRWSDLGLLHDGTVTLTVARAIDPSRSGGNREKDTKTHRAHPIALPPGAVVALERHRARMLERAGPAVEVVPGGFIFSDRLDCAAPWQPARVTRAVARVRRELDMPPRVLAKNLRHFMATQLLGSGVDIKAVADRLGHASAKMTLDVYASSMPANDQVAAGVMDGLLGGLMAPKDGHLDTI